MVAQLLRLGAMLETVQPLPVDPVAVVRVQSEQLVVLVLMAEPVALAMAVKATAQSVVPVVTAARSP
jgi:hypothetical protein